MNATLTPPSAADFAQMAVGIARIHEPPLSTDLYALTDASRIYARRLLLEAASTLYTGADAKLLIALLAWDKLAGRQRLYTESDSDRAQGILADMTRAKDAIAAAINEQIAELQGILDDMHAATTGIEAEVRDFQDTIDGVGACQSLT